MKLIRILIKFADLTSPTELEWLEWLESLIYNLI